MEKIFLEVLNMSFTASILVLAILIARALLKKAPRWITCLLWAFVAIRLVCPYTFESIFSLIPSSEPVPQDIMMMEEPQISTGISSINSVVNPILINNFAPNPVNSVNPMQLVLYIITRLWLFGIILFLIYGITSYILLYMRVRGSIAYEGRIKICDYIDTPFILGIISPKIYIPSGLSDEQMNYVVAHEKAHIKRLDHLWKPVGFLILALHWFNPLMWLAYYLLCKDIEIACDEKVIINAPEINAASYAQTLLDCSKERRFILMCPVAFGEVSVKERIKHILNFKRPAFFVIVLAIVGCIIVAICFMTNPAGEKESLDSVSADIESDSANQALLVNPIADQDTVTEVSGSKDLWQAVNQAILEHGSEFAPAAEQSDYKAVNFMELGRAMTDGTIEEIWIYGMAMYMEADVSEDGIEETSCLYAPVVLYFQVIDEEYVLKEYSESGNGDYYDDDIQKMFSLDTEEIALEWNTMKAQQTIDCFDQIILQSGMNPDIAITILLDQICTPGISSSTSDYIKNWPIEFQELIYYGQYSLNYRKEYLSDTYDLKAAIMDQACQRIEELANNQIAAEDVGVNRIHPFTGEVLVDDFSLWDIQDISEVEVVLADDSPYIVNDKDIMDKIKNILSQAVEIKDAGCSFDTTVYIHMSDGKVGQIYPATDSCSILHVGDKYYKYGDGNTAEFWSVLGLQTKYGVVY